jgi:hypothetical protein
MDAALTRERLEKAGFPDAISKVVSVGGAFGGIAMMASNQRAKFLEGAEMLGENAVRANLAVDAPAVKRDFGPDRVRLVDLAVSGYVNPLVPDMPYDNIRPIYSYSARMLPWQWGVTDSSDGLVTLNSALYGKEHFVPNKSYDHVGLIEDPALMDQIIDKIS